MTARPGYYSPNLFNKEGDDHINICLTSHTKLGKVLDPSYHRVVNYPHIGKFASVLNLWNWLKYTPTDDRFRNADYKTMRLLIEQEGLTNSYVPNFRAIIGYATYTKVMAYPDLVEEIRRAPVKQLLSYHCPSKCTTRVCNGHASMVVPIGEFIVKSIQEDKEPNFDELVVNLSHKRLQYLEGFMQLRFSDAVLKDLGL